MAVLLVLAYHAGLPFARGGYVGVDVFFVISGFLITGLIAREIEATGRLDLRRFYERRIRRLLPAAAMTFVGVALITVVVLPVTRWAGIAGDMVASTFYVVNWRLAARSVDYLAQDSAPSPLQHFWTLGVEEQFYIVWPVLIVALAWWARRRVGVVSRRRIALGLVVLAVPSVVWSVYLTAAAPGPAYLVTTTRLWELAIGALLAVGVSDVSRVPVVLRWVIGWVGLAAVVFAGVTFSAATAFPGVAALVPTLGAAAVIFAGMGDMGTRVRVLDAAPLQDVGALSYSLYLWHWPVLIAAVAIWGDENGDLWLPTAVLAVACSAVPAWFTYRAVERPLHRSKALAAKPWRTWAVGGLCMVVGLGAAAVIHLSIPRDVTQAQGGAEPLGAAVLGEDPTTSPAGIPVDTVTTITPTPINAADDNADVYRDGCHQDQTRSDVLSCTYGDPESDTVIALVGDSHAAHWQPALRLLGEQNGWRIETYTKSACLFADVEVWNSNAKGPYTSCTEWSANVVDHLTAHTPDVLVVSSSGSYTVHVDGQRLGRDESFEPVVGGIARVWHAVGDAGAEVLAIVDTPWPGMNMPECVAENEENLTACAAARDESVARSGARLQRGAAERVPQASLVDLTDYVCPTDECPAVIGGVLVMRDSHHLTATYARSLAPVLDVELHALLER